MLFFILSFLSFIGAVVVGIIALKKNISNKTNRTFSYLVFSIAFWILSNWMVDTLKNPETILLWSRLTILGPIFAPFLFWKFTLLFSAKDQEKTKIQKILKLLAFIFISIGVVFLNTEQNIKKVILTEHNPPEIEAGGLYVFLSVYIVLFFGLGFYWLIKTYKKSQGITRIQAGLILLGVSFNFFGALITNSILPILGFSQFANLGPYFSLSFIFLTFYSIVRYRFMGIRFLVSQFFIFSFFFFLFSFFFFFLNFFALNFFKSFFELKSISFQFFAIFIFTLLFLYFFQKIQVFSDYIFFKNKNPQKVIKDFLIEISKLNNLKKILLLSDKTFRDVLKIRNCSILIAKEEKSKQDNYFSKKASLNFLLVPNRIIEEINNNNNNNIIIVREEISNQEKSKKIFDFMREYFIEVLIPLKKNQKWIGLVVLQNKFNSNVYNKEELEFLDSVKSQLRVVIENAILYHKTQNFNLALKRQVKFQTKNLQEKNLHLEKLLKMRGDFLNIASHQLRTPVSVIKGMADMLMRGTIPPEKQKDFLFGIFKKSEKLSFIIHDILSASEMDSAKSFNLTMEPTSVLDILKEIYEDKKNIAKEKKLQFILNLPSKLPLVLSSKRYLEQALVNLVNNAFQYTLKGFIKIEALQNKGNIEIRVSDSGIGIEQQEIPKLFDQFKRTENAVKTYTDGTGLGLFITKKIIDSHPGGRVFVEKSELDCGTTFCVILKAMD